MTATTDTARDADRELRDHRSDIDRIDRTIAALVAERARLGLALGDLTRDLDGAVAYQGAPGAFSEDAARALAGADATLQPCATLGDVFDALTQGAVTSIVVPIENSLAGAVPGCADLIARHDVSIVGEHVLRIAHAVLGTAGASLDDVRRVHSHPVAIAQCERFFRANPHISAVPSFDTAGAVRDVVSAGDPADAAIAGVRAADLYGASILARDVQDDDDNFTRFLHIVSGAPSFAPDPWRKTSLLCRLRHRPGALAEALTVFALRGLNLLRIESRPAKGAPFEYEFHLDVAPAATPWTLTDAIDALRAAGAVVRVLGHYAPATAPSRD